MRTRWIYKRALEVTAAYSVAYPWLPDSRKLVGGPLKGSFSRRMPKEDELRKRQSLVACEVAVYVALTQQIDAWWKNQRREWH